MLTEKNTPIAYFLTFRTYASWLHGDERFSVDSKHNIYGSPRINLNKQLEDAMKIRCAENEFILNAAQRETVLLMAPSLPLGF